MKLEATVLLITPFLCLVDAQGCKYVRFETQAEAERRAVFERCLLNCSESSQDLNPCYDCVAPYKAYGCLLKREENEEDRDEIHWFTARLTSSRQSKIFPAQKA
ncbi:unnamed protein product [Nippostrongylus brasiliensis]|uniref:Secreted protein n=1 Tax=Nippostrongylus brasiliensis TaxID=27835 RepID=A0A0N4YCT5_NIPBR|nr:unnamed protein product [Nippostrongylus brasiliensis]